VITLKYFLKRRNFKFKIEADDNLQDVIAATTIGTVLQLRTTKNSYTFKKLIVRITCDPIKSITTNNDAIVNAIQEFILTA
jgi:hypothetical protein